MSDVCGLVGIDVGSENCLLCVNHGCEGYKKAKRSRRIKKITATSQKNLKLRRYNR